MAARPTAGVYRLLARLEEAETGDGDAVRRHLRQASEASPDPGWICSRCAGASPAWSIVCDRCGAFDSIEWRTPPQAEASALPLDTPVADDEANVEAPPPPRRRPLRRRLSAGRGSGPAGAPLAPLQRRPA